MSYNEYSYLCHYGILGMKWGIRRYQNKDGSLTAAGKEHYATGKTRDLAKTHAGLRRRINAGKVAAKVVRKASVAGMYGSMAVGTGAGAAAGLAVTAGNPVGLTVGTLGGGALGSAGAKAIAYAGQKRLNKLNDEYEKLLTKTNPVKLSEIEMKEGTKFNRTSMVEKEDGKGRIYVGYSKDKFGKEYYSKEWPNMLRKIADKPDAKVYANTYELNTTIKAPSYERRKEAANAVIRANKKMMVELGKAYALDQLRIQAGDTGMKSKSLNELYKAYKDDPESVKNAKKFVDETVKQVKEKYDAVENDLDFKKFTASIPTSTKLMDAYIKELKKDGFNAVFDDNANTEASFIVFDQKMLTQTSSKEIKDKRR